MEKLITVGKNVTIRKMGCSSYMMVSKYGLTTNDIVDVYKSDDDTWIIKRVKEGKQ